MTRSKLSSRAAPPSRGPHRGRGAALALVLALATLPALAGSALAGERDFRVGAVEGPLDARQDVGTMGAVNVQTLRHVFNWRIIETDRARPGRCPNPATGYDWSRYDDVVLEASRQGIEVLPVILGSPGYVNRSPLRAPNTSKPEITNYKCFVRELVQRYGRGGTLVRAFPAAKPIKQWQAWNEPNLKKYSAKNRVRPQEYARLLKRTHNEIKAVDPKATVVMAGLPEETLQSMDAGPFLRELYSVRGIERKFDVLALHPYARNWRGVEGAMQRLRDVLRDVRDRGRYVWITEIGWGTDGNSRALSFLEKSPQGQATQLQKTFRMLRNNRGRYNVGTVTWFRWQDTADRSERTGPFEFAGLYKKNGRPKPSCRAFTQFSGGSCPRIPGSATSAAGTALLESRPAASAPPSEPR